MKQMINLSIAFILFGVWIASSSATSVGMGRSVYIDPSFGGKESGPIIEGKYMAKMLTLDMGQKLKEQLTQKGIVASLSRDKDYLVPIEERIAKAKMKKFDVFVTINLSRSSKDCLNVYYPIFELDGSKKKREDIKDILDNLQKKTIAKDSAILARLIADSLKMHSLPICEVNYREDYILDNAFTTVVVIDFGVSDAGAMSPYVLDSITINKIWYLIAESIEKYFAIAKSAEEGVSNK